jgi:hypothetical protein
VGLKWQAVLHGVVMALTRELGCEASWWLKKRHTLPLIFLQMTSKMVLELDDLKCPSTNLCMWMASRI